MPESYEDQEVRALLLALGYDEKVVGDMIKQVVWSKRAIEDMKYSLAQKAKQNGETITRRQANRTKVREADERDRE